MRDYSGGMDALKNAIKQVGSQRALADAVGCKQSAIGMWLARESVPPDVVLKVAQATAWQVTPHELRPDIYPHPQDGLPAERRAAA